MDAPRWTVDIEAVDEMEVLRVFQIQIQNESIYIVRDFHQIRFCEVSARRTDEDGHGLVDLTAFNTDGFDVSGFLPTDLNGIQQGAWKNTFVSDRLSSGVNGFIAWIEYIEFLF